MNAFGLVPIAFVVATVSLGASPAVEPSAQGFSVRGAATLTRDQSPLVSDRFTVRGQIVSREAPSTAAIVQDGGRFVVMARMMAVAQVCYNDTVFRDDFDGDGG
jgi:hypothetical protein